MVQGQWWVRSKGSGSGSRRGHLWFMCSMCCGSKHLTWCEHAHKAVSMVFKCTTTGRDAEGCLAPRPGGSVCECACVRAWVCAQLVGNLFKYRHAVGNAMPTGISSQVKHISAKIKRNGNNNSNWEIWAAKKEFFSCCRPQPMYRRGRLRQRRRQRQQLMLIAQRGQMPAAAASASASAAK